MHLRDYKRLTDLWKRSLSNVVHTSWLQVMRCSYFQYTSALSYCQNWELLSQLQCNCHTDPMQLSAQKLGLKEVVGNWPRSWKMANGTMAKPGCKILRTKSTTFWASGRGSGAVNSNRMTTSATTTTPNNIHCNAMFEFLWPLTKPESVSCQFHTHKNWIIWLFGSTTTSISHYNCMNTTLHTHSNSTNCSNDIT